MKSMISSFLAVVIGVAGFAESRQADKTLDGYFKQRLADVEMCLEVEDGEQCLRFYHEIRGKGYRLTATDKANIEQSFGICRKDYKAKLHRAIVDPRFREEDVRKWWDDVSALYHDIQKQQVEVTSGSGGKRVEGSIVRIGSGKRKLVPVPKINVPEPTTEPPTDTSNDSEKIKRCLYEAKITLEDNDGQLFLKRYHDAMKMGYRLTADDKESVKQAFEMCREDKKAKLARAIRDPRFKEEDVRKWWDDVSALYNDLVK